MRLCHPPEAADLTKWKGQGCVKGPGASAKGGVRKEGG